MRANGHRGLIMRERLDQTQMAPLVRGGTGSRSEHEVQPEVLPDMSESGTPNVVGLAGLEVGVRLCGCFGAIHQPCPARGEAAVQCGHFFQDAPRSAPYQLRL